MSVGEFYCSPEKTGLHYQKFFLEYGMKHNITWFFMLAAVLVLTGCPGDIPVDPQGTYEVGDTGPGGGIVFFDKGVSDTKLWYWDGTVSTFLVHPTEVGTTSWRYLEAAPVSTEWASNVWGGKNHAVGSSAQAEYLGSGKANTEAILVAYGSNEPYGNRSDYAAKLCDELTSGACSDWFLPSKHELKAMYENIRSTGSFSNNYNYWSSTESDLDSAKIVTFDWTGGMTNFSKDFSCKVRAIRMF